MTNEELTLRALAGDRESIGQLWEQVKPLTFRFAGRFFRRSFTSCQTHGVVLDDLQQECFLAVLDAVKAYDPDRGLKFSSFLSFPLKNHFNALIGCRGNQRADPLNKSTSLDEPLPGAGDPDLTLIDVLEDKTVDLPGDTEECDIQRLVRNAVQKLNPFHRYLIRQQYFQDCTFEAISKESGIDEKEIKKHHRLALKELRKTKEIKSLAPFYVSHPKPRYYSQDPFDVAWWGKE